MYSHCRYGHYVRRGALLPGQQNVSQAQFEAIALAQVTGAQICQPALSGESCRACCLLPAVLRCLPVSSARACVCVCVCRVYVVYVRVCVCVCVYVSFIQAATGPVHRVVGALWVAERDLV